MFQPAYQKHNYEVFHKNQSQKVFDNNPRIVQGGGPTDESDLIFKSYRSQRNLTRDISPSAKRLEK